jgi:beta-fructofuranosidase
MFALVNKWVWDFWFAEDRGQHHLFYLQAPKALGDPELRHYNATVGHAVSRDHETWDVLPDALAPGPEGSWDDLAIWTGSTVYADGLWHMLYTGINRRERQFVQRIGLATSRDLVHWKKHRANPVLEADGRWYGLFGKRGARDQAWRDPWVFWREEDQHFHALITARSASGPAQWSGVLGHARSVDLLRWEVLPPLSQPGEFAQVEVPQMISVGGHHVVLFSCRAEDHSTARRRRLGGVARTGTFCFVAGDFLGTYRASAEPVAEDGIGSLYAGKIIRTGHDEYCFMAFRDRGPNGFVGELTGLIPVEVSANGGFVAHRACGA